MFGVPDLNLMSADQLIEANIEDYIELYKEEYFDYNDLYDDMDER